MNVNPRNYENTIDDNMKSTKGSLYHASNNNTSKNNNSENN